MKITHVEFSALYNLGNYNKEKIALRAQLDDGDTPEEAIEQLRQKAIALNVGHGGTANNMYGQIHRVQTQLRDLTDKIKQATEQWNQVAEFLRAQGIKPDALNLLTPPALMPSPAEEVIEAEYDDLDF